MLTDKRGIIPLSLVITASNTHDMKAAIKTIDGILAKRKKKDYLLHRNRICVLTKDMIFRGIEHESIKRYYISHIRQRGEDNSLIMNNDGFHVCRRWVVERTNSWHNRFRKLLVRYEKIAENYLGLVQLACCIIVSRKIILE